MRCTILTSLLLLAIIESIIIVPPVIGVPAILIILLDIDPVQVFELDGPIGTDVECPFVECNDRRGNGGATCHCDAVEPELKLFTHRDDVIIIVIYCWKEAAVMNRVLADE